MLNVDNLFAVLFYSVLLGVLIYGFLLLRGKREKKKQHTLDASTFSNDFRDDGRS